MVVRSPSASRPKPPLEPRDILITSTSSSRASFRAARMVSVEAPLVESENTLKMASWASGD